jgi:hypothetical protein
MKDDIEEIQRFYPEETFHWNGEMWIFWTNNRRIHKIYIAKPLHRASYEIWTLVSAGKGNRWKHNEFKCENTFDTYEAAAVAFRMLSSISV